MTNDELRRAMTRIADARIAGRADLGTPSTTSPSSSARALGAIVPGDRVLDLRTGAEAVVFDVSPQSAGSIGAISIRFTSGTTAVRNPAELQPRPTPPAGRS